MTVTVICEECGKKYHIPSERLAKIQGTSTRTKCKQCGHILTIEKPPAVRAEPPRFDPEPVSQEVEAPPETEAPSPPPPQPDPTMEEKPEPPSEKKKAKKVVVPDIKTKGMGLRGKMMLLFLVVPLVLMSASGYFAQKRMSSLSASITQESAAIVKQLAENSIANIAHSVARECQLYLANHPELGPKDLSGDPLLKELATQKVGKTGYTALYAVDPFTLWIHPNSKLVGVPTGQAMQKALGTEFARFKKIIRPADKGKNTGNKGYYLWQDPDGVKREKFMVISPIRGTRYGIAATTYVHEFTQPLKKLENRTQQAAIETRNTNWGIMIVTLIVVGLIVSLYGHSLTNSIKHLTDVADRISVGELDAEIQIRAKDEIGSLADAISRMQDSLRLSIMRLRRKR